MAVNASGSQILPPTLIYRGKSLNPGLFEGAPEGTVFAYSKGSFIDTDLFLEWFRRFIKSIPPKRTVLLFLDEHLSHSSLELITLARENDIHLLCFPPHTTNLYQPLDVAVFKPLKNHVADESQKLMRKNKKKAINRYVAKVLGKAWPKALTPQNIQAGFRATGIWPFNPDTVKLPGGQNRTIVIIMGH